MHYFIMHFHTIFLYPHKSPVILTPSFYISKNQDSEVTYFPGSLTLWLSAFKLKPKSSCFKGGFCFFKHCHYWCFQLHNSSFSEHHGIFNCICGLYLLEASTIWPLNWQPNVSQNITQGPMGWSGESKWPQVEHQGSYSGTPKRTYRILNVLEFE